MLSARRGKEAQKRGAVDKDPEEAMRVRLAADAVRKDHEANCVEETGGSEANGDATWREGRRREGRRREGGAEDEWRGVGGIKERRAEGAGAAGE